MFLASNEVASYTVPFPFLQSDHIRVYAGDAGDAVEQTFKWLGPNILQLAGAVPDGILLTIRRFTPRDTNMVKVMDGVQLPAADLNLNNQQLLYILQEQIDYGSGGTKLPGGGAGWPDPGGSPSFPIQEIIDQLMQSPVMGLLTGRLDDIDDTASTLLEEILRSDKVYNLRREDAARVALVETKVNTIVDENQSVAEKIEDVYAKFDDQEAQIHSVQKAVSDANSATATSFEEVNARMAHAESDITSVRQSVVDETSARTTALQTAKSEWQDADNKVTQALNLTLSTTYATKDYAQSVATTQVEALANGKFANLQQRFEALVDGTSDPNGEFSANYTVRINAGTINGTPVIAGMGLGVDSKTGSNFVVMADRFAFVSPTYTSTGGVQQMKYPFVIGTVGGVSTVGINGQLVVDGTITADKIKVNSLSALTANMGEVNGGTFRTFQLDANGAIINPTEFRVEMTNNPGDAYPLWVGAGVKNWNNAVFAVDRSGNAKFGGTVTAQNIMGNLQVTNTWNWTGDITASGGATANLQLDAPVRLGEAHRPIIMMELSIYNSGGDPCNGTITVEKLVGSTWVALRSNGYYLGSGNSQVSTILVLDDATSAVQQYRVRTSTGGNRDGNFHLNKVTGYAFGLR
jgi:hypothetical protein